MKVNRAILPRIVGFIISFILIILNVHNFLDAMEDMIIWKMVLSVIGFMGFLWIGFMVLYQIIRLGEEDK